MKRKISILVMIFIILFTSKAFAANEPTVEVKVNGEVKKGNTIEINVDISNINRFYAASIEYVYDKEILQVESITSGELIKKEGLNKMEFGGDVKKSPNKIDYYFTCTGKVEGFSGGGRFITIKAKVIKDGSLNITSKPFAQNIDNNNNMKLQLCERTENNDIKELNYKFIGVGNKDTSNSAQVEEKKNEDTSNNNEKASSNGKNINSDEKENNKKSFVSNIISFFTGKKDNSSKEEGQTSLEDNKDKQVESNKDKDITLRSDSSSNIITSPEKNKSNSNNGIVVVVILVIFILIAVGYGVYKNKKKKLSNTQNN